MRGERLKDAVEILAMLEARVSAAMRRGPLRRSGQRESAQQRAGLGQDEITDYQQKNQDPWQPGAEHAVQNIIHTLWLHHDPQSLLQFSNRSVGAPGICILRCL